MPLDNFQSLIYFLPETLLTVAILAILTIDLVIGRPSLKRTSVSNFNARRSDGVIESARSTSTSASRKRRPPTMSAALER